MRPRDEEKVQLYKCRGRTPLRLALTVPLALHVEVTERSGRTLPVISTLYAVEKLWTHLPLPPETDVSLRQRIVRNARQLRIWKEMAVVLLHERAP